MTHSSVGPDGAAVATGMVASSVGVVAAYSSLIGIAGTLLGTNVAAIGGSVAAELPSGAAALVAATDIALIATSICNPLDFWNEAQRWAEIADYCTSWTGVDDAIKAFGDAWEGDASEAFVGYVTKTLSPVFAELKTLADAEWMLMITVIATIIGALITVAVPTLALLGIALSLLALAPATFGASLAAQWPATGAWAAVLATGITGVVTAMIANLKMAHDIGNHAHELSVKVNGASSNLDNNRIAPPVTALPTIDLNPDTVSDLDGLFTPKEA